MKEVWTGSLLAGWAGAQPAGGRRTPEEDKEVAVAFIPPLLFKVDCAGHCFGLSHCLSKPAASPPCRITVYSYTNLDIFVFPGWIVKTTSHAVDPN